MKMAYRKIKEYKYVTITLDGIETVETKTGLKMVLVHSRSGETFSAFGNTWSKIGLDLDTIEPGDKLEMKFVDKQSKGKWYKNFYGVKVVGRGLRVEDVENASAKLSKEEIDELAAETFGDER